MKFISILALTATIFWLPQPCWAASEAIKAMGRAMNGPDDAVPCTDQHASAEKRIEFCSHADRNRREAPAEVNLAELYALLGRYDEALAEIDHALPLLIDSRHGQAWDMSGRAEGLVVRSLIYARMGRLDDAKGDASEIIRIGRDDAEGQIAQCAIRAAAGKELEEAITDCDKALALKPDSGNAHFYRGLANYKRDEFSGALKDLNAALDENRHFYTALFTRGVVKGGMGDSEGSKEDMKAALEHEVDAGRLMASFGVTP